MAAVRWDRPSQKRVCDVQLSGGVHREWKNATEILHDDIQGHDVQVTSI